MSIGPPIPGIHWTLEIQGQGHSLKSQHGFNIQSTHIPLVPRQLAFPFLRYSIFKVWPWKSKVKIIAQGHKEGIPPYRFISFSFHVNQPSHSWDTAILKFDIENSRSRSWVRSKFKVTTWVQLSVNSHPFRSMSIGHPISELRLFQNLTLKIKGQGHGWGQSWKSQHGTNIQSTHLPFVPYGSGIPFLSYDFFKIWPWKSRVKVMGEVTVQSHNVGLTSYRLTSLSFHVKRASHSWVTTFLKIRPWKSRVKVMGGVTVQSHTVGLTSCRFTPHSFHVNRPSHSWDTVFSKFDLENQGSRSNDHDVAQLQV